MALAMAQIWTGIAAICQGGILSIKLITRPVNQTMQRNICTLQSVLQSNITPISIEPYLSYFIMVRNW